MEELKKLKMYNITNIYNSIILKYKYIYIYYLLIYNYYYHKFWIQLHIMANFKTWEY